MNQYPIQTPKPDMQIRVKGSTLVRPTEATPRACLRLSNLDTMHPPNHYVRCCYFYRSNATHDNFFDPGVLRTALGRALVHFYPAAGRLKLDNQNRTVEIDCNDEGVLFEEAEADGMMDDLGYLDNPIPNHGFCPEVDRSRGMLARPLVLVQMTRFKCGGICLGFANHHQLFDGVSGLHFINTWSDIARGLDVASPPFLDRTILSARDPPQPMFAHVEYQTPPKINISTQGALVFKKLGLTQDQMNALKEKCKEVDENVRYSSYEVLVGHVWRCISMVYQLPKDQEIKLNVIVDGRTRLQPPLPKGFIGNAVFFACCVALACDLYSNPVKFTVRKVHKALARMDDEYLRSAIDYLELQCDRSLVSSNVYDYESPNLEITSWNKLPFYDADFGWGRPDYVGGAGIQPVGATRVLPTNDGTTLYGITLPMERMEIFEKLFYDI